MDQCKSRPPAPKSGRGCLSEAGYLVSSSLLREPALSQGSKEELLYMAECLWRGHVTSVLHWDG